MLGVMVWDVMSMLDGRGDINTAGLGRATQVALGSFLIELSDRSSIKFIPLNPFYDKMTICLKLFGANFEL